MAAISHPDEPQELFLGVMTAETLTYGFHLIRMKDDDFHEDDFDNPNTHERPSNEITY